MAGGLERLEFHDEGFQAMLKSDEVAGVLNTMAQNICDQANDNAGRDDAFEWSGYVGKTRARATVRPASYFGARSEADDKTLTSAFGSYTHG